MIPPRLAFSGPVQTAWDSTSLSTFKECPRKYQLSIQQGYSPRHESVHLTFGIYMHKGLEEYHKARAEGQPHDEALVTTLDLMLTQTFGWVSDDSYKNRTTFIRTLVWYLDTFKDDPAKTVILASGKPAVELSFRFELPGGDYLYCGHMDRIAEFQGKLYVFDVKTTKSALYDDFFQKFSPHNQMTGYTLGGKITFQQPVHGVVIDAAQVGVTFSRFRRGFTYRTEDQLDEWLTNTSYYVKLAASYAESDFFPMNESACHNYGGCPFRGICSKSPRQRQTWLDADFARRFWDPLAVRGDI